MAMCLTYQSASGVLSMLTALLALKKWREGAPCKSVLLFILEAAVGYCAATAVFMLFIQPVVVFTGYVSTAMPAPDQLIPHAISNLRKYFSVIWGDYDSKWLVLIAVVLLGFLWACILDTARNRILTLLLAAATAAFMLLFSFGLYPLLEMPTFYARSMIGMGVCLGALGVSAVSVKKTLPAKVAGLALAWCFFVFAFTTSNALAEQKAYTQFREQEIVDALKDLEPFLNDTSVIAQIQGSIDYAPALRNTVQQFPLLIRLIPNNLCDYWRWGYYQLQNYYGLPHLAVLNDSPGQIELTTRDLPVLDETIYHVIRGQSPFLLIEIKP